MTDIQLKQVKVCFDDLESPVLDIPQLTVPARSQLAITGESGSGKTTLINIICGLEKVSSGEVLWGDVILNQLGEGKRDAFRGEHVGLIMQDFHLYPGLTAIDNVLLPARFRHFKLPNVLVERAYALLDFLAIKQPKQTVEQLSRGEKQRVAIARALVNKPSVLIADEPTASLDVKNGEQVRRLLLELTAESTFICVTHDALLAQQLTYRLHLVKGQIIKDIW